MTQGLPLLFSAVSYYYCCWFFFFGKWRVGVAGQALYSNMKNESDNNNFYFKTHNTHSTAARSSEHSTKIVKRWRRKCFVATFFPCMYVGKKAKENRRKGGAKIWEKWSKNSEANCPRNGSANKTTAGVTSQAASGVAPGRVGGQRNEAGERGPKERRRGIKNKTGNQATKSPTVRCAMESDGRHMKTFLRVLRSKRVNTFLSDLIPKIY